VEGATPAEKAARGWLEPSSRSVENHVATVAQIIQLKLELSLTLNVYVHVLPDMGDGATGAMGDALE
jgi:hypothetical protein